MQASTVTETTDREHARRLFDEVDAALPLVSEAAGRLGAAGDAAMNGSESPAELLDGIVKFSGQRSAHEALELARPHLEAIYQLSAEARTWPVGVPEGVADPKRMALDLVTTGNILGAFVDVKIHNRLETQHLEVGALLDELGRLHARLRSAYGFRSATREAEAPVPSVMSRRRWSLILWSLWCVGVLSFVWYMATR